MESAGLGRSRCIRYDGGWETVYWLDGEGALVLPQQVLASYRLPAGGTVQVGRVCAQSVELWPGQAGEATGVSFPSLSMTTERAAPPRS